MDEFNFEIDEINSLGEAVNFWRDEFGEPDWYSRREDFTDVQEVLSKFNDELASLERQVRSQGANMNVYKMNRTIALHFVVEAGHQYLNEIDNVVHDTVYEEQLTKIDEFGHIDAKYYEE